MKKLFLLFFFAGCGIIGFSQKAPPSLRLNVYTNYVFDDQVDSYYSTTSYYNGTVKGGFQWGLGLEYMLKPVYGIELSYLRQDTKAPTTYYDNSGIGNPVKSKEFDLAINCIFLGGTRYYPTGGKFEPYSGIELGAAVINLSNPASGDGGTSTKFAWGIKGGSNIWLGKKAGIKLQAALASTVQAVGGGLYFGASGISPGLASYSTVLQFSLGGGLVFRMGGK